MNMRRALVVLPLVALALLAPSPASAQSSVADILAEQGRVAAAAARARADARAKIVADLAALAAAFVPARVVPEVAPAIVVPSAVVASPGVPVNEIQQRYLEEALAYQKEQAAARPASASIGGWILWVKTMYVGDQPDQADRWTPADGYDTAVECHAAAKTEGTTMFAQELNKQIVAKGGSVSFVVTPLCFPGGFDPRPR